MVNRSATIRSTAKLSKSEDTRPQCTHSRGHIVWLSRRRLGQTASRRKRKTIVWRCIWHQRDGPRCKLWLLFPIRCRFETHQFLSIYLQNGVEEGDIDRNIWGELESESEESSEEEDEEGEDLGAPVDESGLVTPAEGMVTPSGLTSGVPPGLETPDTIELRKKKIENEMEEYVYLDRFRPERTVKLTPFNCRSTAMKLQFCIKFCQRSVAIVLVRR